MGFVSSNVYNRDIIGEEHVLLMAQNCLNTKANRLNILKNTLENNENLMTSEAYLKLFTPFADDDDLKVRRYKTVWICSKRKIHPSISENGPW